MKYLAKYEIAFKGLKEGKYQFEFEIDDKFFEQFENSEVEKGSVMGLVELNKQSTLLILKMTVKGNVELLCDRCLDNYQQPIQNDSTMYIKFSNEAEDYNDDVIVITFDDNQINVAQYLYELIILGLPIKHVHPNDEDGETTCNPEMVSKLNEYLVEEEEPSDEDEEPIDDRWSELKKLLDNK